MNSVTLRHCIAVVLLPVCLAIGRAADQGSGVSDKDGRVAVSVTWDDAERTPATGVYIEAHGFAVNYVSEKSFVFKMVKAGQYEAALPPGVYDVFVSEASSFPRCRRVLVTAGHTGQLPLMLEHDDVYLER